MSRWLVPFLLLWLFAGALHAQVKPAPARQDIMELLDDSHPIVPGDNVSIRVLEDRRDADVHRVPENGMIETVYLKDVKAAGLTCRKLAKFIRQKLLADPAHSPPLTDSGSPTVVVVIDNIHVCDPGRSKLKNSPIRPSSAALDNTTKLKPGWTLGIRIVEDRREKLQQVIAVTGEIQAPYVGLVKAGGLTCAELAAKIKGELEKSFFHRATVLVTLDSTEREPQEGVKGCFSEDLICVFGNVSKAGKYELPQKGDLTVSGFLQWAGGHTSKKTLPKIQIVRNTPQGNKRILVDAEAILIRKSKEHDLFLRPYDVMLVD